LQPNGAIGLIATNTVAQGDTREVGLDAMVADGFTITRAIQSRSWPASSANLEYAAVWGTCGPVSDAASRVANDVSVRGISTLLEPAGRVTGVPLRLSENADITFEGCKPYGMGFVITTDEAQEWIAADARNAEVLFPYLNGEDLNSRPDASASRWVIDFNDRSDAAAATYPLPFTRILTTVKIERAGKARPVAEAPWWLFFRSRPMLRRATAGLSEVLVIALVSKTVMPLRVPTSQVFSHALGVFATDDYGDQAVLSSTLHQLWAITYGSTLETRVRYTPSDVFETFPRPSITPALDSIGQRLDSQRRDVMTNRQIGLTKLYNMVNDPNIPNSRDPDINQLRQLHIKIDLAVVEAFGWNDIQLSHGFFEYRGTMRWSLSTASRIAVLDRLLEVNHQRGAAEVHS
jgi:hypothetical protein